MSIASSHSHIFPKDWPIKRLDVAVKDGDIVLGRGRIISKPEMTEHPGIYPVYSSAATNGGLFGYYGVYMFDEELITWSVDGGGKLFYRPRHKFSITNVSGFMQVRGLHLDCRFLHAVLDYQHSRLRFDYTSKAHPSVIDKLYYVPYPPLPEQRKIAEILSEVDDVIEKTDAVIQQTQQLKKGLIQKLFTEGMGHNRFKETKIGLIPEEWELSKLLEISVDGINNGVFNDPQKVGRGYRLVNVKDMYSGSRIDTENLSLVDLERAEFTRNKIMYGDVFFTRSSLVVEGIGFCNINLSRDDDITFDGHLMRVRPDQKRVLPQYLVTFCKTVAARKYLVAMGKTTTMTTMSQRDLGRLTVAYPTLNEQHRIVNIISEVDNKIEKEQAYKAELEQVKKGLMQVLLTGKMRVHFNE